MAGLVWGAVCRGLSPRGVPRLIAAWISPVAGWLLAQQSYLLLRLLPALMVLAVLRRVRSSRSVRIPISAMLVEAPFGGS